MSINEERFASALKSFFSCKNETSFGSFWTPVSLSESLQTIFSFEELIIDVDDDFLMSVFILLLIIKSWKSFENKKKIERKRSRRVCFVIAYQSVKSISRSVFVVYLSSLTEKFHSSPGKWARTVLLQRELINENARKVRNFIESFRLFAAQLMKFFLHFFFIHLLVESSLSRCSCQACSTWLKRCRAS